MEIITNSATPTEPKLNRAQRRKQAKIERKRMKMIETYIAKHPEAIQFELDEDKIKELEEQETVNG